jgi:hypothetical protein
MIRHAKPVFLDSSGLRSRLVMLVGIGLGVALLLAVGLLVVAVSPGVSGSLPGLPRATQPTPQSTPEVEPSSSLPGGAAVTASKTPSPNSTATPTPTPTHPGRGNTSHPPHPSRTK